MTGVPTEEQSRLLDNIDEMRKAARACGWQVSFIESFDELAAVVRRSHRAEQGSDDYRRRWTDVSIMLRKLACQPHAPNDHMTACDRTMGDSHPCTCHANEAREMLKAALTAQDGWQPIESAPMDGKHILLCWPKHKIRSSGRYDIDENFDERPAGWVSPAEGWRNDGDQCIPRNQEDCTHWMPIPPYRAEAGSKP